MKFSVFLNKSCVNQPIERGIKHKGERDEKCIPYAFKQHTPMWKMKELQGLR